MSIRYAGAAYNHASGTRGAFDGLSNQLEAEGHPPMVVLDGDREKADQLRIWYARMTLTPGSRKVYGTAWWNGQKWYRIHPDAVGIPDTSNHEKRRANDLAWPYNSNTAAHRRAQQIAPKYGITCEGMGFREWWHWTFWGPLGNIGAPAPAGGTTTPAPPTPSWEDDMPTFITSDGGQSLEIGGFIVPLANPEEVASIQITPGKLVCSKVIHARIHSIVGGRKSEDVIVNVLGGDGTRYVWSGGILTPIAYQQTVDQLIAMGAGAVDWPLAEVERILAKQG